MILIPLSLHNEMPSYITCEDEFWTSLACSGERKVFKSDKQRTMWKKLHQKKCECCAESQQRMGNTNIGWSETTFDGRTVASFLAQREDRQAQEITNFVQHRLGV